MTTSRVSVTKTSWETGSGWSVSSWDRVSTGTHRYVMASAEDNGTFLVINPFRWDTKPKEFPNMEEAFSYAINVVTGAELEL